MIPRTHAGERKQLRENMHYKPYPLTFLQKKHVLKHFCWLTLYFTVLYFTVTVLEHAVHSCPSMHCNSKRRNH